MINNRKAYKIFMDLPKKERKKLQIQYDIESTENLYGHDTPKEIKWLNRFHIRRGGSFWNWLWMCHFKAEQTRQRTGGNEI